MKNKKFLIPFLFFSLIFNNLVFAEDTTPQPYNTEEFPTGLKDLRRFEIISLGALPFVTLDATLVYSGIRYVQHDYDAAYKPDIFSKSSFTTDEQKGLILTSLGISVGIGLTDYIVQLIKRSSAKKQDRIKYEDIHIYPISEDPDATLISIPDDTDEFDSIEYIEDDVQEVTD